MQSVCFVYRCDLAIRESAQLGSSGAARVRWPQSQSQLLQVICVLCKRAQCLCTSTSVEEQTCGNDECIIDDCIMLYSLRGPRNDGLGP